MADALLTTEQRDEALARLDGWQLVDGRLERRFEFADFVEAFGFMARVAIVAEKLFHHPDWSNSWNRVDIAITNHDAGGLTGRCIELAERIDALA